MRLWPGFAGLFRRLRRARVQEYSHGPLREFVYLDEVSVYSLLASRKGGIATEFTENQTASLNSSVGGEIGIGFAGAKASVESSRRSSRVKRPRCCVRRSSRQASKNYMRLSRRRLS